MDYRQLGDSGLRFSELILGTMGFGGGGQFSGVGQIDLDGAKRQIDMALDAGVNVIDTADIYTAGASEEIVGQALEGAATVCWSPPRRALRWVAARTTRDCRVTI